MLYGRLPTTRRRWPSSQRGEIELQRVGFVNVQAQALSPLTARR